MGRMPDPRKTRAMWLLEEKFGEPIELLLAQGTLNEVAEALDISPSTVSKWRLRLGLREKKAIRSEVTRSQYAAARVAFQRLRRPGTSTSDLLQAAYRLIEVEKQFRASNRRLAQTLRQQHLRALADGALDEDGARDDVTTKALVPPDQRGRGVVVAKDAGVVCGLPVAAAVFAALDGEISFEACVQDGALVSPGDRLAAVVGPLAPILSGERVALNLLQRLSGVATATRRLVDAVAGLDVRILDTRKTTPGLRALERYAVRAGGGHNHRLNLSDAVLIKDNHLAASRAAGLTIAQIIERARRAAPPSMRVEIEVTTVDEAREALDGGADALLLDNMSVEEMRRAVEVAQGRAIIEASGRVTLENVRAIAETGVDVISVGGITHSAPALDISLDLEAI